MNSSQTGPVHEQETVAEHDPLMAFARRWWWLLAVGAIIGVAIAFAYSRVGPVSYQTTALLQVVTPSGSTTTAQADQARSASGNFAAEISSPRVYNLVSQALTGSLDLSASDLEAMERDGAIVISAPRTSNFIRVNVLDPDPDRAQLLADTIATVYVADITERWGTAFEARQVQLDEQIQFTRDNLATAALRQRENDLRAEIRQRGSEFLTLQTSYQQEIARQAEFDAIGDRSTFSESELAVQIEARTQLIQAISQQISDANTNITALNEELIAVREELATLPPDTDGLLSAAFTTAYSLQLSNLTQQYVSDQIAALTQSAPVLQYGSASTPYSTMGTRKLAVFGLMGGVMMAAGLGFGLDLFRKWQVAKQQQAAPRRSNRYGVGVLTPDVEHVLAMVDEFNACGKAGLVHLTGAGGVRRSDQNTPAGD